MNIFEALREEHEIQRDLVAKLVETHGDTEERKKIFEQLKHELKIHADAEERHFYIPLIKKDLTQEKARHSVAEHHEMDELIEELEDTEMDASNWLKIAKELEHKVTHHLDEEEQEVFQMAGKALTEKQKTSLAEDYNKEIKKMR
ncbi:hemerythrin domain-containing protein [Salegentibacter sp. BDJ18]|uniref:hemerythrin domain-containing protein n=1 Tax=Salegentibacter sp. BDJ18 TaxID=2816376 RepID=UPI001AAF7015|nr:hemerythrin domain-containing protein [Salegentibacter sp. BDJ18]MBO2545622.1 hemerythrin domain-containing protein [Salegentibacter sp. BDJ18]|tara:strand:- start:2240 stop:2674 length:435 start_codon:yes stop_codon:yes gene_type:complete